MKLNKSTVRRGRPFLEKSTDLAGWVIFLVRVQDPMGTASMQAGITEANLATMSMTMTTTEAVMATTQANLSTMMMMTMTTTQANLSIMSMTMTTTEAVMATKQANLSTITNEMRMHSFRTVSGVPATKTTLARKNVILSKQSTL